MSQNAIQRAQSIVEEPDTDRTQDEDAAQLASMKGTFDMVRSDSQIITSDLGDPMNEEEYVQFRTSADAIGGLTVWADENAKTARFGQEREYAEIESPNNANGPQLFSDDEPRFEHGNPSPVLIRDGPRKLFFKSDIEPNRGERSPLFHPQSPELMGRFDTSKDPEEEYFRLSCLALKIIYNDHD